MADTVTGTLEDVERQGPFDGDYGQYDRVVYKLNGQEFARILKIDADDPAEQSGDSVKIDFQSVNGKRGQYNKVLNISKVSPTTRRTATTNPSITKAVPVVTTAQTVQKVHQITTTKDISMEVSGLLQSIIGKHGLTEKTEDQLREALQIKRRVASELESGNLA